MQPGIMILCRSYPISFSYLLVTIIMNLDATVEKDLIALKA
jgi:hypothetical protein